MQLWRFWTFTISCHSSNPRHAPTDCAHFFMSAHSQHASATPHMHPKPAATTWTRRACITQKNERKHCHYTCVHLYMPSPLCIITLATRARAWQWKSYPNPNGKLAECKCKQNTKENQDRQRIVIMPRQAKRSAAWQTRFEYLLAVPLVAILVLIVNAETIKAVSAGRQG